MCIYFYNIDVCGFVLYIYTHTYIEEIILKDGNIHGLFLKYGLNEKKNETTTCFVTHYQSQKL